MPTRTLQPKKPTLTTVVALITSVRDELKTELKDLRGELKDVRETVDFLKENVPMRDEVAMKDEVATKSDLADFKSDVISHVDHFVQLHKKQEIELVAVAHRMTRHEEVFHGK